MFDFLSNLFLDVFGFLAPIIFGGIALYKGCQAFFGALKNEIGRLAHQTFERMVDYLLETYFPHLVQAISDRDFTTVFRLTWPCGTVWGLWYFLL